jgi:hypothetical protein
MTIPNYREGKCCYHCKHGVQERSRCGEMKFYCTNSKHEDEVSETGICDDYEAECICTSEDTGKTSPLISVNDLKEFLEGIDQRATDDEDEETPPEYYEGIFSTTNEIRRKFGIPLSNT